MNKNMNEAVNFLRGLCTTSDAACADLEDKLKIALAENERQKNINSTHLEEHQRLFAENAERMLGEWKLSQSSQDGSILCWLRLHKWIYTPGRGRKCRRCQKRQCLYRGVGSDDWGDI